MADLGSLGGKSFGLAINEASQVAGQSYLAGDIESHPVPFTGGPPIDLGTFGGTDGTATAINARGQAVGSATTAGNARRYGFFYSGGHLTPLGLGGADARALALNDRGQVVGWATDAGGAVHAFLFSRGVVADLVSLVAAGIRLTSARGINDRGQILAEACPPSGPGCTAYLLTPRGVP